MTVTVHRRADAVTMLWRNGGGVTHELVRRPSGGDLVDTGGTVELRPPLGWYRFAGSTRIDATLPDGPTTDLNLMWRRDQFDATVRRFRAPFDLAPQTGATLLAFAVDGAPVLDGGIVLAPGDVAECPDILHIDGAGTLLVFALVPR